MRGVRVSARLVPALSPRRPAAHCPACAAGCRRQTALREQLQRWGRCLGRAGVRAATSPRSWAAGRRGALAAAPGDGGSARHSNSIDRPQKTACALTEVHMLDAQWLANLRAARPDLRPVSPRHAAVLVPLFQDAGGTVRVLLTLRSSRLNSHAGEVSLPGGKRDAEDADDAATALREAQEEVGLEPRDAQVVAEMAPMLSKHGLSVKPVVACVPAGFQAVPNQDEVTEVFDVPLASFLEVEGHRHEDRTWDNVHYRVHYFQHGRHCVWGLTAMILIQVAQVVFGRGPAFAVHDERSGGCSSRVYLREDGSVAMRVLEHEVPPQDTEQQQQRL